MPVASTAPTTTAGKIGGEYEAPPACVKNMAVHRVVPSKLPTPSATSGVAKLVQPSGATKT